MAGPDYTVCRVAVARTLPLRKAVLRPHLPPAETYLPPDATAPSAVAYAALDPQGEVIGAAVLTPEQPPFATAGVRAWRLGGMAVAPEHRNRALGSALVEALVAHVAGLGGGILWCNARIAARGLYERGGMSAWGEVFEQPQIGPHIVMWRRVGPLSAARAQAAEAAPGSA